LHSTLFTLLEYFLIVAHLRSEIIVVYCSTFVLYLWKYEMSPFPDVKTHGNGQMGKKGYRRRQACRPKLAEFVVSTRHVPNMLPTFPTKAVSHHHDIMI
jgi:hypothetical protein